MSEKPARYDLVGRSTIRRKILELILAEPGARRDRGATAVRGSRQPDPIGVAIVRILGLRLRQAYGQRLRGVYLFGSRARGDHEPDSDVDVLIVLDRIEGYGRDLRLSGDAGSNLSLANGLPISRGLPS